VRHARAPDEGAVCHALTFGEYWIGLNDAMQPGALYRECVMTTIQAVEAFGAKNVSTASGATTTVATTSSMLLSTRSKRTTITSPGSWAIRASRGARSIGTRTTAQGQASSSSRATRSSRSGRRAGTRPATMHGDRGRATMPCRSSRIAASDQAQGRSDRQPHLAGESLARPRSS
jgi:hypothetical protein